MKITWESEDIKGALLVGYGPEFKDIFMIITSNDMNGTGNLYSLLKLKSGYFYGRYDKEKMADHLNEKNLKPLESFKSAWEEKWKND